MKKVYIYRILILSIGMLISWHARTQDKVEKQIHAGYQLPADGKFSIDNKYGIVEIEGWDKDSVVIDIIISVKHRYLSKAEDLLDRIEPRFVTREDHIHATSIIRDKRKSIFNDFFKDVFQLDINKTDVDIDYKIMLPNNVELEITNLFGDVVIDNCYGDLTADVSHGTLWLNSLLKSTDIQLKFGRLDVRELPDSRLSLKNSKAYINSTGKIDIESTGSEIEIKDIDFLQVKSARDEYDIERINTIRGDLRYTDVRIQEISEVMDLTTYLGGVRCDVVTSRDLNIRLDQKSSDIDINISGAALEIDVTMEGGSLRLPESAQNLEKEILDETKNTRHVTAIFGNNVAGSIVITGIRGSVIIREF